MALRALFKRQDYEHRNAPPQVLTVTYREAVFAISVVRNKRSRRYTLRIDAAARRVVLTIPPRGNLADAKVFAEKNGEWIASRLAKVPEPVPFVDGAVLPLRGIPHRVAHRPHMRGTAWVEIGADGERLLCVAGQLPHLHRRVADFLKREARRDLEAASRRAAAFYDVKIARIAVRDQVSRWGSCSVGGVLSYSWRLIFAPSFVLDYLAIHEVAHLIELNHSRRFWTLVERACGDYREAKHWLDAHGASLHRYGAVASDAE